MSKKNGFLEYVLSDAMQGIRGVTAKAMFGGFGLYKEGIVFGIIADDELYFKVDEKNLSWYKECHSKPFTYEGKNRKMIVMSYWEVPAEVLEDRELLADWVDKSVAASLRKKKSKTSASSSTRNRSGLEFWQRSEVKIRGR